ncbi:ssDNA binding protein [Streptomyces phage Emma1919]|uniref:SsDNA binding protein n=2 Tax=Gilsonvirus gilson TaxID=2846398 RepID=A0A3Q9R4S6_9CAUD|nr:single strand DNA binding protein [Streptomyces phage Gilson]QQV92426.1 ssDNA binding protein [Streptomyces phage MeganTheeKilla]QZE11197.1 ssDNA binding protein [Streptomyces phage Forrest]QZE11424.1 ssDNA binding protein [Streptomyces phage Jada]URQ04673.1 ssDNA binding protein [Streptomyces phage Emma1919]AZU97137.1 ssDNA binding protein [Streptomyces phage Gilson]
MAKVIKGLASIQANQKAQQERAEAGNRPKADWFKFPKGQSNVTVRFLQELDPGMEGYREDRGIGFIATEHNAPGPDGWKRRGLCTVDDGACYACERHKLDYKAGWRQKQNLYINVLADLGDGPKVYILTRNGNSAFAQSLIEEAVLEGSITNANFRITKTGEGTSTQWLLRRMKDEPFDDSKVEVWDLDKTAVREVEYEKQPEYYGEVASESDAPATSTSKASSYTPSTSTADDEW